MSTRVSIAALTKTFGSGSGATTAVDAVSIEIDPGELFFLLGPSGCGKTTLLRMLAGFVDPSAGSIAFDGRDVTHTPPSKRNTGMVFQSYALWPHMSVLANVAFGLGVRKVSAREKTERARRALEAVHMGDLATRKPNQLSGGQQQRVALARALVIRPDVLLLDEPLSNLDARLRIELRSEIRRICKDAGITTVYVTHDQKEALSMADRVAIIRDGRIIQTGPPADLYRRPRSRFVAEFLGETNLLPGTVVGRAPDRVTVQTGAGRLVSAAPSQPASDDRFEPDRVLCSIRPEAISLIDNDAGRDASGSPAQDRPGHINRLSGTVVDSTYLGELAQHTVRISESTRLKVAQINPALVDPTPGRAVRLDIDPGDVVLVPDQTTGLPSQGDSGDNPEHAQAP